MTSKRPSKVNRLNMANQKLADLIGALNKEQYPYTHPILMEMALRKDRARRVGRPVCPEVEWACKVLEERLEGIHRTADRLEAVKRINAVAEEYDEAMVAMEAYNEAEGN